MVYSPKVRVSRFVWSIWLVRSAALAIAAFLFWLAVNQVAGYLYYTLYQPDFRWPAWLPYFCMAGQIGGVLRATRTSVYYKFRWYATTILLAPLLAPFEMIQFTFVTLPKITGDFLRFVLKLGT